MLRESGAVSPKPVLMLSPWFPIRWWIIYNPVLITEKELKVLKLLRHPGDTLRAQGQHNLGTSVAITERDKDEHQTTWYFPTAPELLYKWRSKACCIPPPDVSSFTIPHNSSFLILKLQAREWATALSIFKSWQVTAPEILTKISRITPEQVVPHYFGLPPFPAEGNLKEAMQGAAADPDSGITPPFRALYFKSLHNVIKIFNNCIYFDTGSKKPQSFTPIPPNTPLFSTF